MENRQFEELAKALAQGAPRRKVLKGLLGGALGSAFAVVGLKGQAEAAPRKCRANQQFCNGRCIPKSRCCVDLTCTAQCVAGCFGFNGFSLNQTLVTFNQQSDCETGCLAECSSGNCP